MFSWRRGVNKAILRNDLDKSVNQMEAQSIQSKG